MPQMTAREEIPRLLEQLLDVAAKIDGGRRSPFLQEMEDRTDQIATLVAAGPSFLETPVDAQRERWRAYRLTRLESRLADVLHENLGKAVRKSALKQCSAGSPDYLDGSKLVEVKIWAIRKKFAQYQSPFKIVTHTGFGYEMVNV